MIKKPLFSMRFYKKSLLFVVNGTGNKPQNFAISALFL